MRRRLQARTGVLLAAAIALAACSKDDGGGDGPEPCEPGTLACACGPDDLCLADEDGVDLICLNGFCTRGDCDTGTQGCVCLDDGTCEALDGVPMSCVGNVCVETELAEPGELGGPCDDEIACAEYEGVMMDCVAGVCQIPGCPSGTLGCPCGPFGACEHGPEGEARCSEDGFCSLGSCDVGTLGCECDAGSCGDDLVCQNDVCRAQNRVFLAVEDADVRACDVVLSEAGRAVESVVFAGSVRGESLYQRPRTAMAFFGREDAAIAGSAVTVVFEGLEVISAGDAGSLVDVECYDRTGTTIDGVEVLVLEAR